MQSLGKNVVDPARYFSLNIGELLRCSLNLVKKVWKNFKKLPQSSSLLHKQPINEKNSHLPPLIFHFLKLWTLKCPKQRRFDAKK